MSCLNRYLLIIACWIGGVLVSGCHSGQASHSADASPSLSLPLEQMQILHPSASAPDFSLLSMEARPYTLVAYLDATCSICLATLRVWKEAMPVLTSLEEVRLIFVAYGQSEDAVTFVAYDRMDFSQPIYFDATDAFRRDNASTLDGRVSTVLLDQANHLIWQGNPAFDPNWLEQVQQTIRHQ